MNTKNLKGGEIIKQNHPYAYLVSEIARYRYVNNLTNKDLAKKTGLSRAKIAAFITGTRVNAKTAKKLAETIGLGEERR